MNDDAIDRLQGQVQALTIVLQHLITTHPRPATAAVALAVRTALQTATAADALEGNPAATAAARAATAELLLAALTSPRGE